MNKNQQAFNRFLKCRKIYKKFYVLFNRDEAKIWRRRYHYPVSEKKYFKDVEDYDYVGDAFPWPYDTNVYWGKVNDRWYHATLTKSSSPFFKLEMPKYINIL